MKPAPSSAAFNPDAVASINRAYAEALAIIGGPQAPADMRAQLADHMMYLARNGVIEEDRLCERSVVAVLGRNPRRSRDSRRDRQPRTAGVRRVQTSASNPAGMPDPPLSAAEVAALRSACGPVGLLSFPPPEVIRSLRLLGYVDIVLGGIQITPYGLERLLRERDGERTLDNDRRPSSNPASPSAPTR